MTESDVSPDSPPPRTTGGNWRWEPPSPAALEALLPGYTVERLLGRGGMGAVYKGIQISLERPVAIKILPSGIDREDPTYAERFRNEAKVMARLLHPAVVAVFDFGQTADGQLYFVMEYVDGTDIHGLIGAQGRLPVEHALAITAHVCDALTAAHGLGIVHRDIKPSNVLINQLGQVKVADFGLAKVDEPGQHGLTRTGYALGTPDFVAPEALVLGVAVDGRADLYAVGVMLYQMLTGDLPKGAWKAPSEKVSGLDPRFDAIVIRAMQGEPADRYQSAAELRRDLDVILTVPLVKSDAPATAALPQQAVAGVAGKRSVAAKVPPPAPGKGGGRPPRQGRHTAPVKPPAPAAKGSGSGNRVGYLSLGIGAVVLLAAGIFYAVSARGPVVQSAMAPPHLELVPPSVPKSEGPVTGKTDSPSSIYSTVEWNHPKLQHLESLPNGWGKAAADVIPIPGHAPDNLLGDVALRLRFRFEDSSALKFHIRSSASQFGIIQIKPTDIYIAYSEGRQSPPKIQTIKTVSLPQPKAPNIERFLEIVLISHRVIVRIDNETLVDAEVADLPDRGGANLTFGGGLIRDFQKANLDGITDPLAALKDSASHSPSQPLGDSLSLANPHPSTFGGYPAGLKVPIPDWLQKASEEGGRLEFKRTEGIPAEFDPLFDLGEAAKFDDFVAVYRSPYAWLAVRKSGDLWGRSWDAGFKAYEAFGPIRSASVIRTWNPIVVDQDGVIHSLPFGGKLTESPGISGLRSALGISTSNSGSFHILLGSGYQTLETRNTLAETIPPPPDFFRGAKAVGASNVSLLAAKLGEPLRGWDLKAGAPVPIENPPTDVVEIAGGGTNYVLLNSEGGVMTIHATTGAWNVNSSQPPTDLGAALRVRNAGAYLAQRADGTWSAWQSSVDRQSNDKSSLISLIDAYGPALDMETGTIRVPGQEPAGFWAIAIRPKSIPASEVPNLTTNPVPSPVPSQTTPSPSPQAPTPAASPASPTPTDAALAADLLVKAKMRGGRLRTVGQSRNGPFQISGPAATFDDFVQVSASHFGWAARRATGETFAGTWGGAAPEPYQPLGPYETTFLSRASFIQMILADGTSRNVWSDSSQLQGAKLPAAERIVAVMNHVIRFEPDGKQHWLYGSASPEKPDFLTGGPLVTGTYDSFVRHRQGEPVASWVPKNGTEFTFPDDTRDTVEMDGGQDHVILLDARGKVQVWREDGKPLEAEHALRTGLPSDLDTFVAVRAGKGMSAAQRADGTWVAWGTDATLAKEIGSMGKALDLDLFHDGETSFALWIEPGEDATKLTEAARLPEDVAKRLAEIEAQFQAAYDRDVAPGFDAAVTDLDTKYRAAVQRALDAATGAGNLDESVKLRAEIQRLDAREPLPETDAGDLPESLRKLRATYRDTHGKLEADRAAKAKPYHDRYDQLLDAYQKELTQQQRIDDALKVKARRDASRDEGQAAAPVGKDVPAAPPAPEAQTPPTSVSNLTLPPWLEAAAKEGGKLRIWGTFEGKPIDEKEALKEFRERDYTKAMTGNAGLIMGIQRRGTAKAMHLDQSHSGHALREYRNIQAVDRGGGFWLSENQVFQLNRTFAVKYEIGSNSIIAGNTSGEHLLKLESGEWLALGLNWNRPGNAEIQPIMRKLCEELRKSDPSLVSTRGSKIIWIASNNQLRQFDISYTATNAVGKENSFTTQPKEPVVELLATSGSPIGHWAILGSHGTVYAGGMGGFEEPVTELTPARTLRFTATGNAAYTLAVQKPDGTWHAKGSDSKFNEFISSVGPALDMDVYMNGGDTRIVLWIEPESSL